MSTAVTPDANTVNDYLKELKTGPGRKSEIFTFLLDNFKFRITRKIESEWANTNKGDRYFDWFSDAFLNKKIIFIEEKLKLEEGVRKKIFIEYGFPKKDFKYISCALNTDKKYIVTDDCHFYDPKKSKASREEKGRIKSNRSGKFCRYLKNTLDITIGNLEHCCVDFEINITRVSDNLCK